MRALEHSRRGLVLGPWLVVVLSLAACGREDGSGGPQGPGGAGAMPPAPVTVASVEPETIAIEADYTARVRGMRHAEVRARVGGILEERLYEEGAEVAAEAPLFRIDPAPYRIALERARAELANARAALNQAEREWRRVSGLFDQAAISGRERDLALSNRELAQARLAQAEAGVSQAELELGYTTVRAPVPGTTGLEQVTAGNLINVGALLTTVTQLDPVQLRFALPATDAATRRALQDNAAVELGVELYWPDGSVYAHRGQLDYLASNVDPDTGNVVAQAVFPNRERALRPGETVRVRLVVDRLEGVFLLPPEAVSQGAEGPKVFLVTEENTAQARAVRLGPLVGGRQVVLEGLGAGDRVVINGQVALQDGAAVTLEGAGQGAGQGAGDGQG
ncbi:efflux RND transporter periplasmic adaptor subunit [Thioalkalivibrio sp. XN279]|uniref:efflux RND transporter periplasmic adaptor subunit n=1 Tax=Thioalkalivibrio sp. XN279 TaxID=2714953 RepID=UPI00140C7DE0|nr:efflux RND transporter periplasmic adaptor subunit [Thioalkalivibrio sp. XN279]NHA13623.1 efflux RND transporter periplasmic adaptor subunit [Thioalkalivibrio sp. XN279]